MTKDDIMDNLKNPPDSNQNGPSPVYSAEDIRIQQYGNTAIVAFKLVAVTDNGNRKEITEYLNSGTFLKRNEIMAGYQLAGDKNTLIRIQSSNKPVS